jgi:hypothetical protein
VAILPAFAVMAGVKQGFAQFFGGTSLLIMVGVLLDTLQQIESHLLMRHYDGLMKTGRIKGGTSCGITAWQGRHVRPCEPERCGDRAGEGEFFACWEDLGRSGQDTSPPACHHRRAGPLGGGPSSATTVAVPGFKGLYGCPSTLLISVNEEVVHGLPGERELREGDVASVDCGVLMNGFYGDSAYTFQVGEVTRAGEAGLAARHEGMPGTGHRPGGGRPTAPATSVTPFSTMPRAHGYGVVRELVGHGVGRKLHEAPEVPNYGQARQWRQAACGHGDRHRAHDQHGRQGSEPAG